MTTNGSWDENRKLINFRLDQNDKQHEKLFAKLEEIHADVGEIKSSRKALVAGISAGVSLLVAIIGGAIRYFTGVSN